MGRRFDFYLNRASTQCKYFVVVGSVSFSIVSDSLGPMDCSLPGSVMELIHGILQARILEWLPCPPPGDLPDPGTESVSAATPALQVDSTTEPLGKPNIPLCRCKDTDIDADTDIDIYAHRYHTFFIHSSVSGYLGCFDVLAIVNSATLSIGVHVYF